MLPGYINQFSLAFTYFRMGQVFPITSLTLRLPYPLVGAHSVTGPYDPTVVFTLQSDYAVSLKIYLPKLYATCVDYADTDGIKLGKENGN